MEPNGFRSIIDRFLFKGKIIRFHEIYLISDDKNPIYGTNSIYGTLETKMRRLLSQSLDLRDNVNTERGYLTFSLSDIG